MSSHFDELINRSNVKLNIGCGASPLPGWVNVDNSMSLFLSKHPLIYYIFLNLRLLNDEQINLITFFKCKMVKYAKATNLPFLSNSVSIIYSSHMLEHLDRNDALLFLHESLRVLEVGGTIRLCLPDIYKLSLSYLEHGDADRFVEATLLNFPAPRTIYQKLKYFAIGPRNHLWMYDSKSLSRLLIRAGFKEIKICDPGDTRIENGGEGINLFEHSDHSFILKH